MEEKIKNIIKASNHQYNLFYHVSLMAFEFKYFINFN